LQEKKTGNSLMNSPHIKDNSLPVENPEVFFNGKQIFATDSPEDAEIIEYTREMLAVLEKAKAEKTKLSHPCAGPVKVARYIWELESLPFPV